MGVLSRCVVVLLFLGGLPLGCFQDEGPDGAEGAEGASGSGGGGGETDPCPAYVEKMLACDVDPGSTTDVIAECEAGLDMFVGACRDAYVGVLTCYGASSCVALNSGAACQAEVTALANACFMMTSAACTAYGQNAEGCGFEATAAQGAAVCQAALDAATTQSCATATEGLYMCLADLSCGALWGENGCEEAHLLVMTSCA